MSPRGLAVVGTDTGVGKTVVTAGLVGWLRETGVDARAIKPAQTGCPPDDDAGFVADACGTDAAATCVERFGPPLAPAVAAEREGRTLSYAAVRDGCERALADAEVGVVEGIGGLRVPLTADREVVDLVADLRLPAVVVARSGLGTLNHTALTVEALERRDVEVRAVVLNEFEGATAAERTNPAVLERMVGIGVRTLPPTDLTDPRAAIPLVREHLPGSILDSALA
ncbi:dethiobiotin synthase [Halomarina halobia]|uniref:ATP-dependent dethiobiotin synthetase BioD n=1 Tax=Halomarina halobia TaxID=3033386 RepID=A0ABD6A7Z8_9EURY|nr:dethiobiotin synthase [Halomarina sp. PSR21]